MDPETQSRRTGHESSRMPLKGILWSLAGFVAAALMIHVVLIGYGRFLRNSYKHFGKIYQVQPSQVPQFPAPALQTNPPTDLQTYKTRVERDLNTYDWVDRAHGVVKIPVERAMSLLATRGLPVRPPMQNGSTELDLQNQKAAEDSANAAQAGNQLKQP